MNVLTTRWPPPGAPSSLIRVLHDCLLSLRPPQRWLLLRFSERRSFYPLLASELRRADLLAGAKATTAAS